MTTQATERLTGSAARKALGIVDCDVHLHPATPDLLERHLPARWLDHHRTYGPRTYEAEYYPRPTLYALRTDLLPSAGEAPRYTDLDFFRAAHLDAWDIQTGVITPLSHHSFSLNLEYGAAVARAYNHWQAELCSEEPRMRGSIVLMADYPEAAVAELERWAGDPRFVQGFILAGTNEPAGRRRYWPIYETAAAAGLPVGVHFGGLGPSAPTGTGYPSTYLEDHAGAITMFQDHVTSLVCEAVFERFPQLRVVLVEGGFAWLAPLMWRLDAAWNVLRSEVPELERLPSEVIREHIYATTQPMEEPPSTAQLLGLLELLGMEDKILFSTDYPHWDFDSPDLALPPAVPEALRRRIMGDNARALYRLSS